MFVNEEELVFVNEEELVLVNEEVVNVLSQSCKQKRHVLAFYVQVEENNMSSLPSFLECP